MNLNFDRMAALHLHKKVIISLFGSLFLLIFFMVYFQTSRIPKFDESFYHTKFSNDNPNQKIDINKEIYSLSKVFLIKFLT